MYVDSKTHKIQYMYLKNSLLFKYRTRCLISFVCTFFLFTSHFVPCKSSNCTSSLHSFSNSKVWCEYLRFKNYWRQNLLIPSVPRRRPRPCNKGRQLTAVAGNNLPLFYLCLYSSSQLSFLWPYFLFILLEPRHNTQESI